MCTTVNFPSQILQPRAPGTDPTIEELAHGNESVLFFFVATDATVTLQKWRKHRPKVIAMWSKLNRRRPQFLASNFVMDWKVGWLSPSSKYVPEECVAGVDKAACLIIGFWSITRDRNACLFELHKACRTVLQGYPVQSFVHSQLNETSLPSLSAGLFAFCVHFRTSTAMRGKLDHHSCLSIWAEMRVQNREKGWSVIKAKLAWKGHSFRSTIGFSM